MRKITLLLSALLLSCVWASAQVKLGPLFCDNMVMQQLTAKAPIWGEGTPGKAVTVTTSWDGASYTANANTKGRWQVAVSTPSAGGPYTVTISDGGKKPVVLRNVMIGEVWLCSGQSNMEMPVEGWGHVNNWQQEKADANHPDIRLLRVAMVTSKEPSDELVSSNGGWQVCSPKSVANFSACAYFFGRDIAKYRNVPVGLIDCSWGGTIVEAWTSAEALQTLPSQSDNLRTTREMPATVQGQRDYYAKRYKEWFAKVAESDVDGTAERPLYADPAYDDGDWKDLAMPYVVKFDELLNRFWWMRKTVDIPQSWVGKDLVLNLGKVDDNEVTYFNGVQVGSDIGYDTERTYTVPASLVKAGKAVITIHVHDTGIESGIDCDPDRFTLTTADGSGKIALAGVWRMRATDYNYTLPIAPLEYTSEQRNLHTALYNAMVHPLIPYTIKGAIWYQGENNHQEAYQYRDLMPLMISDWRAKWGYDFPFYMVQLANYLQRNDSPQESAWAELREAQLLTRRHTAGVGMATIIDIGDANDIHPKNKQEVGRRLALAARATAYGENIVYEGPAYSDYKIEGSTIRVSFAQGTDGGLTTAGGKALKGFAIADADRQWHWADARIEGNTVVVSSPDVRYPVAVRYAWADNPECNLVNADGLPASPFRTDNWPGVTATRVR